jgi:uncharacterized iron-regulated protein
MTMKTVHKPRVVLAAAAAVAAATLAAAPAAAECVAPARWSTIGQSAGKLAVSQTPAAELIAGMARRDVVLLGEAHDENDHHRWQLHTLAALHVQRPNMVIGFEMFPRRVQPVLDKWVAGELSVQQFLAQTEWEKVWNTPPELYLPLFQFARMHRIPMVALNVNSSLTRSVREKGWDSVPEAERENVGRAAPAPDAYRDFLFEVYEAHAGMHGPGAAKGEKPSRSDPAFRRFVEAQTTWDRAMAEALAKSLGAAGAEKPLAVGIMGSGHVQFGHGVPHQLRALGIKDIGTLIAVSSDMECADLRAGLADAVFGLPPVAREKAEPARLGATLVESDGTVRLSKVNAGSLAERAGLRAGDQLLEIGGTTAARSSQVTALVRGQPAGSWLPVRIRRGEEILDVVIKFPAR